MELGTACSSKQTSNFIEHEDLSGFCCAAGYPRLPDALYTRVYTRVQRQDTAEIVHAAKQIMTVKSHRRVNSAILFLVLLAAGLSKLQPQELCGGGSPE